MFTRTPRIISIMLLLVLAAGILSGCSAARNEASRPAAVSQYGGGMAPEMPAAPAPAAPADMEKAFEGTTANDQAALQNVSSEERIVIKNGTISVIVPDPGQSMDRISAMAEEMGGYVVAANLYKEYASSGIEVPRASITIRVPAEKLDEAMDRVAAESSQEPRNVNINSQDVTNEYVDLGSRLANLEAAEKELTRIMQEANRTEDVLSVYQQLVQIREQIEVIKGQMKYYERSAALSALTVELIADAAVQPIEIGGWQPKGVAKDALEALARTMQGLGDFIIWLIIYILPVALVLGLIFILPPVLIIRAIRRRRRARKTPPTPPAAE